MDATKRVLVSAMIVYSCVVALRGVGAGEAANAPPAMQSEMGRPCVTLSKQAPVATKSREKGVPPYIVLDPKNKQFFKPMTRQEVKLLISALKPVKLKGAKGQAIAALKKGSKLSLERVGMLMQDITAVLAKIHLQETVAALKKMPNANANTIAWGTKVAKALDMCGRMRYAEFGGDLAFQESIKIVLENRAILESLVLESKLPIGKPPMDRQ